MPCPECGSPNRPGGRFCVDCGHPLAARCPGCGSPIEHAGQKFCGECGLSLVSVGGAGPTETGPNRTQARGGGAGESGVPDASERRVVSVLFADLVGFTTLAEGRDAEDTRDLLSRYFEHAREVVGRYAAERETACRGTRARRPGPPE